MPTETQPAVDSAADGNQAPDKSALDATDAETTVIKDGKPVTPETPEEKLFKKGYVDRLRATADNAQKEAKELRTKLDKIESDRLTETGQFKDLYEKEKAERTKVEAQRQEDLAAAEKRFIRAEVKAKAAAAGIQDAEDVALLDFSKFKIDDATGEVEGAAEAVEALKKSKPYLFKGTRAAAVVDAAGKPVPPVESNGTPAPTDALKMSKDAFKTYWDGLGKAK